MKGQEEGVMNGKRAAAIISAYTGTLISEHFSDLHEYIEEVLKRPVQTMEMPHIVEELKTASRDDLMEVIHWLPTVTS